MQIIRDKAQGIVAWVLVGIVAFVLCFWGVSGYINTNKSQVLAKVNGREITASEVDNIYSRWLAMNSAQPGFDPAQVDAAMVKQQITIGLAQQAATINSLLKDGMAISDAMIIENIKSKRELQEDAKFSIARYKQLLKEAGISETEFETIVRDQLLINQLQLAVLSTSFATPQQAERIMELRDQSRDFGYAVISADKFQKGAKISEEAIAEFYNTHKERFLVPEQIRIEYVELSLNDMLKQVQVDDKKLEEYYKANQQSFVEPKTYHLRHIMILAPELSDAANTGAAQKQIDEIYAQLQKGAKFTELAQKYSEDKQSARNGGDLGWASPTDEYPAAVFTLQKNGDYTKPVQTEYGWHIFQLAEIKGGQAKNFNAVREVVAQRYKRDEAERLFSSKGDELANLAFENPASLTAASEQLHLPIKTSEYFTKHGGTGVLASSNVLQASFSNDVLVQNHNSDLVRVSDDSYIVLRIKDKQAAYTMPLEEARNDIVVHLKHVNAKDEAKHVGAELLAAIKETNNPNKAANSQNIEWIVKRSVDRDNKDLSREMLERVFSMPKPEAGKAFSMAGFSLLNGDYVVVALTKVNNGTVDKSGDSNLLEKVTKQIASYYGQVDYAAIQAALIEQAKIKYY